MERYSMKADNIKNIISDIDHLPYRAILFDGTWGIGKSYAVNEALEANPNVCKISMFGLKDPKQIYHEALFQLALKNNIGGKIGEITNNVLDGLSKIWDKVGQAKEVVQSIANERELFLLLSKEFTSVHIIVIDDLERMSDDINLEDIFGIIEELKQCNYVKVIVIANTDEIQSDKKVVFEKYNEKVIERIYHITERAEKVTWSKMNIHADFVEKFLEIHKVKNLRTLEKAQRFFEDVKLFCNSDMSEQFKEELRLICGIFLLLSVGMGIFVAKDLIFHNAVVEGWISTMSFMALGFFGVFALLTIILKYLSVMLNLIFKKQRYLIMDIEKVVKGYK